MVLVYGDTNSTLAGALAAAQAGVPVAHVEAGMRSFDRSMPEELNRVLTDHASALLLCSVRRGRPRPARASGVAGEVVVVGDVMVDVVELLAPRRASGRRCSSGWASSPGDYLLATAHRAGNVDDPERLAALVELLTGMPRSRSSCRCTRARGRGWPTPGCSTSSEAGRACARAAARLPRLHGAAAATPGRC